MVLAILRRTVFGILATADLYSPDYYCHIVLPLASASVATADQTFVNLDWVLAADAIPFRADHTGPKFMKDLERGFVAREPELALELKRGLAGRLGCNQISAPEPGRERRMRLLHHRRSRQRSVDFALTAAQYCG